MAVDYSILTRVPTIGSRIVSGMEAGREAAIRNQLLARQNQQFEQAQEDRRRALQREQQQDAAYEQIAGVLHQAGQDPDNPAVLQQLTAEAFKSRNPQVISAVSLMTERAAKRRQAAEGRARVAAIMGGQPAGAAPAMAATPAAAAAPAAPAAPLTEPPAQPLPPVSAVVGRNALAPATAAAAPVNAMTTPAANPRLAAIETEIDVKERQRAALLADSSPEAMKQAAALQADLSRLDREYQRLLPKQRAQSEFFQLQEALSSLPPGDPRRKDVEARMAKLTKDEAEKRPRVAPVTLLDGTLGSLNLDTGEITPAKIAGQTAKGKPTPAQEKAEAQRKQLTIDLDRTIAELTEVSKPGGLIDQSTGSGAGRLVDIGAAFVGKATPGAIAIGKLQPIADMVLKMVPRFEGPQSDKDTKSYREAAGQLADPTLPTEIRRQAATEIIRLMKERKKQFVTPEMAAEGEGAGATAGNFPAPPAAAIEALKQGQGTDAQFDAIFGPGAAARARGR